MRIGIDVGGTNTDAVLMDGRTVVEGVKTLTTDDITSGIAAALASLLARSEFDPDLVTAVTIGTTHFTNAIAQAEGLARTAALRLGSPGAGAARPLCGWPPALLAAIDARVYECHGGHEFDGREISALRPDELRRAAADMAAHGVTSVAITSVFSPVSSDVEQRAAEVISREVPELMVSLSHEIGRIGLLERENATVLNASLRPIAERITSTFVDGLTAAGIDAPLYLSRNDGTLTDVEFIRRYPVATFHAGPSNSMRGAALLAALDDCVVVDMGGTTTDIGPVDRGYPRPATAEVAVAGVPTNLRMPDVVSLPVGGGSLVRTNPVRVGPDSLARTLEREALVFGGPTLTLTDIAVAAGCAKIGDPAGVRGLDPGLAREVMSQLGDRIARHAASMVSAGSRVPLVVVGGGSALLDPSLLGDAEVLVPPHHELANAIGAAIGEVGGAVDRLVAHGGSRPAVVEDARSDAINSTIEAGADPSTVRVVEVECTSIPYLPGDAVRVRVKAVGEPAGRPRGFKTQQPIERRAS